MRAADAQSAASDAQLATIYGDTYFLGTVGGGDAETFETEVNALKRATGRGAFWGMLCGLADGLSAMTDTGIPVNRVLLVGGAARSAAVRAVAPTVLGARVVVPRPAEYVALGAARQAAWVLAGTAEPPVWDTGEPEAEARRILSRIAGAAREHVEDPWKELGRDADS